MSIKIGELAKKTGCQVVTIRFYEKEGLLHEPERTEKNYRVYNNDDVERVKFIRHCRKHDMKLSEIRDLLEYRDHPKLDCTWVGEMIGKHINNVEEQIQSLSQLKSYLLELQTTCSPDEGTCGIVKRLSGTHLCGCEVTDSTI